MGGFLETYLFKVEQFFRLLNRINILRHILRSEKLSKARINDRKTFWVFSFQVSSDWFYMVLITNFSFPSKQDLSLKFILTVKGETTFSSNRSRYKS